MKSLLLILLLILCPFKAVLSQLTHYETIIYSDDVWTYFVGTSKPDADWRLLSFDDSSWLKGQGGIGFGDDDDKTIIPQTPSVCLRMKFQVADLSRIETLILHMDYDDAFVAYLNGKDIARGGITGDFPGFDQLGTNHEARMKDGLSPEEFILTKAQMESALLQGDNVLAIQVHNSSATSSDMSAIAFLTVGVKDDQIVYRSTPSWFTEPFVFQSSNIPIVLIETENRSPIVDEPKTKAHMKIIHDLSGGINTISDFGNIYDGNTGIEIRGSYSARLPQKPYGFETRDSLEENLNVPLLHMPKENDWILLANYNDKVFMRNTLPFELFRKMGHYAPRTVHCEVSVNGIYDGIYVLTEKIKRDKNRVDVSKLDLDDNAGDSITGGYIFKVDYFTNDDSWAGDFSPIDNPRAAVHYVYSDPEPDEITEEQKTYLQDYIKAFETNLYGDDFGNENSGYRSYVNVNSFLDYFIISELSRNVDGYKKSKYYFKDKESKGGLINSGPVWDFDWAWKNLNDGCEYFNARDGSGWAFKIGECNPRPTPSGWTVKLMEDPYFVEQLGNRYRGLRKSFLSNASLFNYIDSVHTLIDEAQNRHYTRWPILGINVGAPETDNQPDSYDGEITKFKNWINTRLAWLDDNMPEETFGNGIKSVHQDPVLLRVFPNPSTDYVYVESDQQIQTIELYNSVGGMTSQWKVSDLYSVKLDLQGIKSGIYVLGVSLSNDKKSYSRLIIR